MLSKDTLKNVKRQESNQDKMFWHMQQKKY